MLLLMSCVLVYVSCNLPASAAGGRAPGCDCTPGTTVFGKLGNREWYNHMTPGH